VAQRVDRGIALLFHDHGTRRVWVVSSTLRPHFTPGKDLVRILQESGWAPGPVWMSVKSRAHRDSIPDRPAHSRYTDWATWPTSDVVSMRAYSGVSSSVNYKCVSLLWGMFVTFEIWPLWVCILCSTKKLSGLIFRTSCSRSGVMYICHHNSSPLRFPYLCSFSVFHSLQSITPHIY